MTNVDEKIFVKNAISKVVEIDKEMQSYCEDDAEFEFYSMYDAVVRDLWDRTSSSFDSYDQFLNYCCECKKEAEWLYAAKFWSDYIQKSVINKRKEKLFDLD